MHQPTETQPADRKVIACNHVAGSPVIPVGSAAYVVRPNMGQRSDRICVLVRTRSGRWIEKWESAHRLANFRLKTLPPEHPRHSDARLWGGCTADDVDMLKAAGECEMTRRGVATTDVATARREAAARRRAVDGDASDEPA